jgi:hypothetical protein
MCMMCPSSSNMILPLWRSFIWSKKPITLYAAIDFIKFRRAFWNNDIRIVHMHIRIYISPQTLQRTGFFDNSVHGKTDTRVYVQHDSLYFTIIITAHSRPAPFTRALWVCATCQQPIRLKCTSMHRLLHVKHWFACSSCFVLSYNLTTILQVLRFSQQCSRAFHSNIDDKDSALLPYTGIWLPIHVTPSSSRKEPSANFKQFVFTKKKLHISSV